MDDLFKKRMDIALQHGNLGGKLIDDSNYILDKTFSNDPDFRNGNIYDWDMNILGKVDFKFIKSKTFTAEGYEIEYMIQFRPNFNPEYEFKNKYYKYDSRERLGFYIDVYDYSKKKYEKWLIVGKDDKVAFDRYNAFKCNWCFEWISEDNYHKCVGVLRDSISGKGTMNDDDLGGTSVNGLTHIMIPSNIKVSSIELGTRFIIGDNLKNPQTYEVIDIIDTSPLGVTNLFLKQCLFNPHTDVCGIVNNMIENKFCFELPIEDLPDEYGKNYHMICNCIKSKGLPIDDLPIATDWKLYCNDKLLYVNGQTVEIKALSGVDNSKCEWHIFIDNVEYLPADIADYFEIFMQDNVFKIKAINIKMNKYIVKVAIYDENKSYYDSVEMEVVL